MNSYRVYGLDVKSDPPLADLGLLASDCTTADVEIRQGDVPERLRNPEIHRRFCQVLPGEFLLSIPEIGRFLVKSGSAIVIELASNVTMNDAAPYLLGSCFGALLQQRGRVALHGAGVCIDGRVFLICGPSGVGKSTITAHLCAKGMAFLCDDLAAVSTEAPYMVQPGFAQTRLTDSAATSLGFEFDSVAASRAPTGKLVVSTAGNFANIPYPLAGMIVIEQTRNGKLGLKRLPPQTTMEVFRRHTYRRKYITSDIAQPLFAQWGKLASAIPVCQITRPHDRNTTHEVVAFAEQAMEMMQPSHEEPYA